MIPLFAHHIEPQHVPVLVALFAAGFWIGSQLLSQRSRSCLDHGEAKNSTPER